MNDVNTVLRETLERHAGDVAPSRDFAANIVHRSRQIRHRRVAATSTAAAAVVGVTSVAAVNVISHERHGRGGAPAIVKVTAAATPTNSPTPSPTPGFKSPCPDGQTPQVSATGAALATGAIQSGAIQSGANAETVTQALMQSYLTEIDNQTPLTAYGVGTDTTSGQGVVWIQFQGRSAVELVVDHGHHRWSAYNAALGPCTPLGS
jgi:hypothetical protein